MIKSVYSDENLCNPAASPIVFLESKKEASNQDESTKRGRKRKFRKGKEGDG